MTTALAEDLAEDLDGTARAMARRFAAGATLWSVAPAGEPVIAGRGTLPAFALTGPDLVGQARAAARSGDVLIAVAGAPDEGVADLMRRSPAWGTLSVWIGSGRRPAAGAADHVLWADDTSLLFVRLWELTHACLGQPGRLAPPAPECTAEVCVTCRDEGRLAEVLEPPASVFGPALVRTEAGVEAIDVTLVGPVVPGDLVLVHAGAALTRLDSTSTSTREGAR